MRYMTFLLVACLSLITSLTWANDDNNDLDQLRTRLANDWQLLKYDRAHNVKTYVRREDGQRYRSYKVEGILNTSMNTLAQVLLDLPHYTEWFWQTLQSKLIHQESATEYLVYMVHQAPYGLPNRDTVIRAVLEPQKQGRPFIIMRVTAVPDGQPLRPPLVRVQMENMLIKLTPMAEGQIRLEAEGSFDPGGVVPVWAANMVQRQAPYAVLLSLQQQTEKAAYNDNKNKLPFAVYEFDQLHQLN